MVQLSAIGDALFTKTQQRVLGLLYGKPEQSYYLNEIVRLAAMGKGTVRRELEKLTQVGLLTVTKQGNQNHYQANKNNPVFAELKGITQKTFGIVDILRTALQIILEKSELAFVYGSIAKGVEHGASDIDVMLVGDDLDYTVLMGLLIPVELQLGRKLNPTVYSRQEFIQRQQQGHHFLTRVLAQDKLWLVGEDSELLIDSD